MVVFGIVRNDNHVATTSRAGMPKLLKKSMKRHSVESLFFSLENQLSIAQPDGAKVSYALSCWVMPQHRVLLLGWYPHPAPGSILLKMDFIGRPEIYSLISYDFSKFFYMPPEPQDRLGQSRVEAYAAENQEI